MNLHQNLRPATGDQDSAAVISFDGERSRRRQSPAAADHAAEALSAFRRGETEFKEVLAALIAPFAGDPPPAMSEASGEVVALAAVKAKRQSGE